MKNKKNIILIIIAVITLFSFVAFATYAYFNVSNLNVTNVTNFVANSESNNMVFYTVGGGMSLNVTMSNMSQASSGSVASQNTTTLTVNFQANTSYSMVCSYDIVYEWTSSDKYQTHSTGVTDNEFSIQATLTTNSHVNEGINNIKAEADLTAAVGQNNSAVVVSGAQIDGTGTTTSTAAWTLSSKVYNVNANQVDIAGKNYAGKFKVDNISCVPGTKTSQTTLATYLVNTAAKSGTDAVSSSPWILTADHPGEWRYAGKNPDNYVQFNGELWRIIGVMPNMTYCTGTYGQTSECDTTKSGSLVKIVRNQTIRSSSMYWDYKQAGVGSSTNTSGSNDWSDSQLMLMLNGSNYLKTGYDVNGNQLHTVYTITSNVVSGYGYNFYNVTYSYLDGNGTTVYIPSQATTSSYSATSGTLYKKIESTALNQIATVKWDLYGTNSFQTGVEGTPAAFYNKERNINNTGEVYTNASLSEKRPVYWYGKVGLMYPSDYGYATNGNGSATGIHSRNECLGYNMSTWGTDEIQPYCARNDWLWFKNITSSSPGTTGAAQWTIVPNSGTAAGVFYIYSDGFVHKSGAQTNYGVRPVLYLEADTLYGGSGSGTWNNPYTIS